MGSDFLHLLKKILVAFACTKVTIIRLLLVVARALQKDPYSVAMWLLGDCLPPKVSKVFMVCSNLLFRKKKSSYCIESDFKAIHTERF